LKNQIPHPTSLITFEAAARLESFTLAAQELRVSQAAVSLAMKALEADVGTALFTRTAQRIRLTEAGRKFFHEVAHALAQIARATADLRAGPPAPYVTFSSSTAFASHWLIPRLSEFRKENPEVEIRIETSDRDIPIRPDPLMIGVRRWSESVQEYAAVRLCSEVLVPVCSPSYLDFVGGPLSPCALAQQPLIHLDEPHRPRPTWADWFASKAVSYQTWQDGLHLNDYGLVVQAAIGGQGIAIGWEHIVEHARAQKLLVAACTESWSTGLGFYLTHHRSVALERPSRTVFDWLLREARIGLEDTV
jgi:DNA-binding transcriptional LysR family regulator